MSYYIINGFPGVGKSYAYNWLNDYIINNNLKWVVYDSDSSKYSHIGKELNPNFPQNYIDHIKSIIENNKDKDKCIILCSTHKTVLESINDNKLSFFLVHPDSKLKEEYLKRYKFRNSPKPLINKIDSSWNQWMCDMDIIKRSSRYLLDICILEQNKYLTDVIFDILNMCGGE